MQRHYVTALSNGSSGLRAVSSNQQPAIYLQTSASNKQHRTGQDRTHEAKAVLQLVADEMMAAHDDNGPHAGVSLPRASQPAGQLGFEARRMHAGPAPLISPIR